MKTLIIHASAGAGHQKAAEALLKGIKKNIPCEAILIDALDYTSPYYKELYRKSYTILITRFPWLWGIFFALVDIPFLLPLVRLIRRIQNALNGRKLNKFLIYNQFDYIISTHFFPTEVAAYLKRTGVIKAKIITAVTDFDVHRIWLAEGVDCYAVASDWTKKKIQFLGVPPEKVAVTGIPTGENFSLPRDKNEMRRKLGLQENIFTVLVATGSFGIGPIEEIIQAIRDIQVVVVCGHNKNLFSRLSQTKKDLVSIFGLVNNMDELMAASDAMVTKPGGLSISEALVSHLPMIFFNAIPGQESNNVRVLKEYGVGMSDCTIAQIAQALQEFNSSQEKYLAAAEQTKTLARPEAVKDIVELIKF